MFKRGLPLLTALVLASPAWAQPVTVTYERGLVSVSCNDASLGAVFEQLRAVAGVELLLEDAVKNKRLTADLQQVPVAMAVQRLLEGNGVNYAVMMDPRDWGRVASVYVGAGGGGPSRPAPPPRRPPIEPDPADEYEDLDDMDMLDEENFDDLSDELVDDPNEMPADVNDEFGDVAPGSAPPGSSPVPSYLPPPQSFPRSRFTPGAPSYPYQGGTQQQQQQPNQSSPPPATMPFTDALGRPIPVPADMQEEEQQRRRQQQREQ